MKKRILSLMLLLGMVAAMPMYGQECCREKQQYTVPSARRTFTAGIAPLAQESFKQINHIQVPATNIASPMDVNVILPESYAIDETKQYPVVYLLNGHGGDEDSWLKFNEPRLDSLASVYDMIMVCPDGRNTWYWDAPIDSTIKMETFLVDELVPYIDKNYRTKPSAKYRAITGFSMGGHGGLWLAMRHSDVWKTGGSMSGGVDILDDARWAKYWDMYRRLGDREANMDVWNLTL